MTENKRVLHDSERVSRHCGPSKVVDGVVSGTAFIMREKDKLPETGYGLSVNCIVDNAGGLEVALLTIKNDLVRRGRNVKDSDYFAVLSVGKTRKELSELSALEFFQNMEQPTDTHAYIKGYAPEDDVVADMIALSVIEIISANL